MPALVVAVFWIWTGVSVVILVHRLVTTGSLRPDRPRRPVTTEVDDPTAELDRVAAFEAKLAARRAGWDPAATTPTPAEPVASSTTDPAPPVATSLADALEGIRMPADLTPLVGERIDPRRGAFVTTTTPAEVTGSAVAAELERLAFTLRPTGPESTTAVRAGATIDVRVAADPATRADLAPLLSSVPDGAVLVEFVLR